MQDIWGQSKNTVNLASSVGLFLSIFTLTPNIHDPKYRQWMRAGKTDIFQT